MKSFLYFALVTVLCLLPFIAGAACASLGGAFYIAVGILVMAESVVAISYGFRYVKEKTSKETEGKAES